MQSEQTHAALLELEAPGGGWPYYRGRSSRVEPTCWAWLALRSEVDLASSLAFLESCLTADRLLADPGSPEPNTGWTGLALLTLLERGEGRRLRESLEAGIVAAKGVQLTPEQTAAIPQDGMLQAWSWTPGTFSWVEPTAYCLLALKRLASGAEAIRARIAEAEAVLLDRVCPVGGWNYGNSAVLGQDLRPYASTTALGLLAMQDRASEPAIQRSLEWLEANQLSERATMALALTALALAAFGRPNAAPLEALVALGRQTAYLNNAHLMAMALYALSIDEHGAEAFRLPPQGTGQQLPQARQ